MIFVKPFYLNNKPGSGMLCSDFADLARVRPDEDQSQSQVAQEEENKAERELVSAADLKFR